MHCHKYNKTVLVENCEECFTYRKCDPVCVKRGFVWGVQDRHEPLWEFTYKQAQKRKEDVSCFFDPGWQGNEHLKPRYINKGLKIPIPLDLRWEVWERDNFTCRFCGTRRYLATDHIVPESKGGETILNNLQTLCKTCNSRKSNKY